MPGQNLAQGEPGPPAYFCPFGALPETLRHAAREAAPAPNGSARSDPCGRIGAQRPFRPHLCLAARGIRKAQVLEKNGKVAKASSALWEMIVPRLDEAQRLGYLKS